jgi:CTP-dependent riboflavin kinase
LQSLSLREKGLDIYLAETGAITNSLKITTPILSKQFNTSQQSASRLLIILEKEGLIEPACRWQGKLRQADAEKVFHVSSTSTCP